MNTFWHVVSRTLDSIIKRIRKEFYKRNEINFNDNGKLIENRGIIIDFLKNIPTPTDNVDYYFYVYNFIEENIEKNFIIEILEGLNIYNYKNIKCSEIDKYVVKMKAKLVKIEKIS